MAGNPGKQELWADLLQNLFDGDQQMARRWLETPVPALAGAVPKDLIETIDGRRVLSGHVQKLKRGDYS